MAQHSIGRRRPHRRVTSPTAALAAAGLLVACSSPVAAALSPPSPSTLAFRPRGARRTQRRAAGAVLGAAPASGRDEIVMSPKLESAAVGRFATGYDKLCKNCPTRLQPRVDTLTEMILGLSDEERVELMSIVENRVEERAGEGAAEGERSGATTAREVYDFQVGMEGASLVSTVDKKKTRKMETNGLAEKLSANGVKQEKVNDAPSEKAGKSSVDELAAREAKLAAKLSKSRSKLERSQFDRSRASHLLAVASLLLSEGPDAAIPASVERANDCNADVDELRSMDAGELELQKLKYEATMAKFEGKMAKARVKMFSANLEMSRVHALRTEREQEQEEQGSVKTVETTASLGGANATVVVV